MNSNDIIYQQHVIYEQQWYNISRYGLIYDRYGKGKIGNGG